MTFVEGQKQGPWRLRATPRRWQYEALSLWQKNYCGVVSVVTGAGKTIFAELCMLNLIEKHPCAKFFIIVPTIALLDQWYISLTEDLGVPQGAITTFSGHKKPAVITQVNILVINTARNVMPRTANIAEKVLIVDECHRAGSMENAKSLSGKFVATLGLSATPEREYDLGFQERVAPVVGEIIYRYEYDQALIDGVIVPFDLYNVKVQLTDAEQAAYDRLTHRISRESEEIENGNGSDENLKVLLRRRATVSLCATKRIPVTAKVQGLHAEKKTIIFHERISLANRILAVLKSKGVNVASYHTGIDDVIRRENLRLFRLGIYRCLVTCRALDEGTNIPDAQVAIISGATASIRQRIQRFGRVLRPAENKQSSTIYTLYATRAEEDRLRIEEKKLMGVSSVTWMTAS